MKKALLIIMAMMVGQTTFADVLTGRVVKVADGDTITVLDASNTQYRVRMTGIDAPEKAQDFGQKSKQSLSDMVYGKNVSVLWDAKDRYGRTLGKVLMPWGDVNLAQIKAGMAWHYKRYMADQSIKDQLFYADEEMTAKRLRKGLWADKDPIPPWEWRHNR